MFLLRNPLLNTLIAILPLYLAIRSKKALKKLKKEEIFAGTYNE